MGAPRLLAYGKQGEGGVAGSPFDGWMKFRPSDGMPVTISSLFICNRSGADRTFSVGICPNPDSSPPTEYYLYDEITLHDHGTFLVATPITLFPEMLLAWAASSTGVDFTLFGETMR